MIATVRATVNFDRLDLADFSKAVPNAGTFTTPGISLSWVSPTVVFARTNSALCVSLGTPRFTDADLSALCQRNPAEAWLASYDLLGEQVPQGVRGAYAVAIVDGKRRQALLAVDRFSVKTLCFATEGHALQFSDRADSLDLNDRSIDPQSVFDYLYFHMIPAPNTVYRQVRRLPAGHLLLYKGGDVTVNRHWWPRFEEDGREDFGALREQFLALLRTAVEEEIVPGRTGAFLSGGTDSSTVAGMLGKITGERARTYSIGFDASGYDEMGYARIAARHFGTDHHEYYVTPADLVESISAVAQHHDQPFGNSSLLPAFYCARIAQADGVAKLLAGDGGDELFGGNSRYATQRIFEVYHQLPGALRRDWIEPVFGRTGAFRGIPGLQQVSGYVRHSATPLPDRLHTFNLLLRLDPRDVLQAGFLAQVDVSRPLEQQREAYRACQAASLINRMLAYDWKFTLADSDLPKVRGAAEMAGVDVGFPLLNDALTDFSLKLSPGLKLKRLKLRYFFKEALRGFLPDAIIAKKKHGFGLPFGVWVTRHEPLRQIAKDALEGAANRGIASPRFVHDLMRDRLREHPAYFGEMVWILMMLELWFQEHAGAARFS